MPLDRLVERCFGGRARLAQGREPGAVPFLVVPGPQRPRWLVPAEPDPAAATVLRAWQPYGAAARLKWRAFVAGWRAGLVAHAPGVERIFLAGVGLRLPVAIYVGTPDRRQKAVLFHASPMAVEKLAIGDDAHAAVAREAEVLQELAVLRPGLAPAVLGTTCGSVTTGWVEGKLIPAKLDETVLGFLAELRLGRDIAAPDFAGLPPRLPGFIEHGDFAPWNIRRAGGRLRLTDFEDARIDGMPMQDLTGWCLAVGHVLHRRPVAEVLRQQQPTLQAFAGRIGLDAAMVAPLVMLCLRRRRELARARGDDAFAAALTAAIEAPAAWA